MASYSYTADSLSSAKNYLGYVQLYQYPTLTDRDESTLDIFKMESMGQGNEFLVSV